MTNNAVNGIVKLRPWLAESADEESAPGRPVRQHPWAPAWTDYSYRTALQTIENIENGGVFNAQELRALGEGNGRKLPGLRA